jgi:hypothetical protein
MLSVAKHLGTPTREAHSSAQGDSKGHPLATTSKHCSYAQPPFHCGILPLCLRLMPLGRNSSHAMRNELYSSSEVALESSSLRSWLMH